MDKKVSILKTAELHFAKNGIQQTKLQDLAKDLRISKKTIYQYFESKTELVMEVYAKKAREINHQAESIVDSEMEFSEKLVEILLLINGSLKTINVILVEDLKAHFSQMREMIDGYMEYAVFNRFIRLVQSGIKTSKVKSDVHPEATSLLYRDALMSFVYMRAEKDLPMGFSNDLTPLQVLCQTLTTIFRGILAPKALEDFDQRLSARSELNYLHDSNID